MRWLAAILAVVLASRTARADEVSPTAATLLAFGGSTASLPLLVGAMTADGERTRKVCGWSALGTMLIGPSLGRWYARDVTVAGVLLRGAGVGMFVAVARGSGDEGAPAVLLAPGVLLVAVGTIYDLALTPRAVKEHNAPRIQVVPSVGASPGLSLIGTF